MESGMGKCKKFLQNGEIHLVDADVIATALKKKPSMGDSLQYDLHNYCKKNMKPDCNVTHVIKLASLCYTNESISLFANMDRFIGCVYYICSYLLKNEKYKEAILMARSLEVKKEALVQAFKTSKDIFNFACLLHNSFMSAATDLESDGNIHSENSSKYSHDLAIMSLKFFQFNKAEQSSVAKKLLKNSKVYLHKLKQYSDQNIIEFYQILQTVTKVLYPKFSLSSYCMYYLFKLENMHSIDYSEGTKLLQMLQKITNKFFILSDMSPCGKQISEDLLNFFFAPAFQNFIVPDFEEVIDNVKNKNKSKADFLFLIISNIFHYGIQHWWKLFDEDWSSKVSVEFLQQLIVKILNLQKKFYKSVKLYCFSCKTPYETCFGDLLTGNLQKIQYTIRLCLKNKVPESMSLVPLARDAFKLSIKCVKVMKEMGCCEMQRTYAWKYAVIHHTNLVEDILKQSPDMYTWVLLADCSRELLHEIVISDYELPYDHKRVNILFQRWHQGVFKQQKYHDGLFVCIAFYTTYPKEETDILSMWLRTKSECENEIIQEITIFEMLNKYESAIKEFNPKFNKSDIVTKSVLLMELKAYASCKDEVFRDSNSFYNAVTNIGKLLEKTDLDVWERSLAYTCLISAHISDSERKLPKNFPEKCNYVIEKLIGQGSRCRSYFHAGNLKFALFLFNVKTVVNSESLSDTNELVLGYLKKAEEEKVKFGDEADSNLTCNVLPVSSHLTVDLETAYLNALKQIVDLWGEALKYGSNDTPTEPEFELWLMNVQLVACLYELYGEYHRSFKTWLLFYRIGKLCNDLSAILLGLSNILANCSDVDDVDLIKESTDVANQLIEKNESKETLVVYWLTLGRNHLKNKRPEKCLEYLKMCGDVLEGLKATVKTQILQIRYLCLVSQFLTKYPNNETQFGYCRDVEPRIPVFKAFSYAATAAQNLCQSATQLESIEMVLAMLEVNIWAFHFYEIYSLTDSMRFFLDDLYQIVQKLFLPTRTAEIIVRLAEVDLICEKMSDCQEKITKLKSILAISQSKNFQKSKMDDLKLPCSLQECNRGSPREISPVRFLETPVSSAQTDDTSPIHMHLPKAMKVEAVEHGAGCTCRLCGNILIQILIMTTYNLEGEILRLENHRKQAAAHYAEAHKVRGKLEKLREDNEESIRLEMSGALKIYSTRLDFLARFIEFHTARLWLRYALFDACLLNAFTESTMNAMAKISKLMEGFSYEETLLIWKFAKLKLLWLVWTREKPAPVQKDSPKMSELNLVMKTPSVGKMMIKDLSKAPAAHKFPAVEVKNQSGDSSSDERNKAFLGLENMPSARKLFIQPRKLRFKTKDTPALRKSVIEVPETRKRNIRPKKLDLD